MVTGSTWVLVALGVLMLGLLICPVSWIRKLDRRGRNLHDS